MHLRLLLLFLSLFFTTDPAGGNDDGLDGDLKSKDGKPEGWSEEIQQWANGLIARATTKAAEKTKADVQADIERQKQQEEADRKRKADEDKGDFERVKTSLTTERDTAISERDSYKSELDEYRELVTADIDAQWKGLPEEVRDAYDGADDDVLAKKRHIGRMAKVIEKLSDKTTVRGNGPGPKPGHMKPDVKSPVTARDILQL